MIQFNGGLVAKNSLWSPVRIPAGWFCPKKREKNASKRFRNNHPLLGAKARSFLYIKAQNKVLKKGLAF